MVKGQLKLGDVDTVLINRGSICNFGELHVDSAGRLGVLNYGVFDNMATGLYSSDNAGSGIVVTHKNQGIFDNKGTCIMTNGGAVGVSNHKVLYNSGSMNMDGMSGGIGHSSGILHNYMTGQIIIDEGGTQSLGILSRAPVKNHGLIRINDMLSEGLKIIGDSLGFHNYGQIEISDVDAVGLNITDGTLKNYSHSSFMIDDIGSIGIIVADSSKVVHMDSATMKVENMRAGALGSLFLVTGSTLEGNGIIEY